MSVSVVMSTITKKKVGVFELESDSALGSYYHITLDNGKEFHDHYFDEKDIIKHI